MRRATNPADLDPLDAAASPISVDSPLRKSRRGGRAFGAVLEDAGGNYERAQRDYERELIASGVPPEQAAQLAVVRMLDARQSSITPEDVAAERNAAVASGVELGINDPAATGVAPRRVGPYEGAGRPGYERSFTSQEILGQRADQEAAMQAQRDQWAEERNSHIGEKYGPEARAIAEAGDAEGVTDYAAVQTPFERERNEERRRYEWGARNGNKAARAEIVQQDAEGAGKRRAFRERASRTESGNMPSESDRWANYRAQMMLAGSNPRKNMVNAWMMMGDESTTPEQRSSLRYMLPGGERAAAVDANNASQAGRMAQAAMTAFLTNNPAATPEQRRLMEQKAREANPAAAGAGDVSGKNYDSPEAVAELDRLAEAHDTSWGGFSYDNERSMARALMGPPYNLPQAEAEALAYRYAERRRWTSGGQPASAASGTSAPAPTPPPARPNPWATGGV